MKNMWEKHTIGKRILALCLLVTMLFDTVTASAMNVNGEDIQMELLETEPALEGSEEIVPETGVLEEMEAESSQKTEVADEIEEELPKETEVADEIEEELSQETEVTEETEEELSRETEILEEIAESTESINSGEKIEEVQDIETTEVLEEVAIEEENTECFCAYNEAIGKLEVAFYQQYFNQEISVALREGRNEESDAVVARGSATVTGDVTFVDMYQLDGSVFVPTQEAYYYEITVGESTFANWLYPSYYDEETYNYWEGSTVVQENGTINLFFYSDILHSEYGKDGEKVTAKLLGEDLVESQVRVTVGRQRWASNYIRFVVRASVKRLESGNYTLVLYKGEEVLASTAITICAQRGSVLESVSASWISDSEMKVRITGLNILRAELSLYDVEGNEVQTGKIGYKTLSGSVGIMDATVSGMDYSNAPEGYYIKVLTRSKTDRTFVEPYQKNGEFYYGSENIYGEYIKLEKKPQVVCLKSGKRISGIGVTGALKNNITMTPVTIRISREYDHELIEEIIISKNQFRYGVDREYYYYCFNKGFWESLSEKDVTYEVVVEADGIVLGTYKGALGYEPWYYNVEKADFYLDSKSSKSAELTVSNASERPTFSSSNPEVAKLTISEEDYNTATITAGKLGTSEITITADGISRTFTVTVANLPKVKAKSSIVLNSFFDEPNADLEITNSWGTMVTSVNISEGGDGFWVSSTEDGRWYLYWDKETPIAKDTKLTLDFEVEGFVASEEDVIPSQTITVNVKSAQPAAVLSADTVNFNAYPYKNQYIDLTINNNSANKPFILNAEDIVLSKVPENVDIENSGVVVTYDEMTGKLLVTASNDAVNGVYEFAITPMIIDIYPDEPKRARTAILKVKLSGKEPIFTFNTTSVTLDAAYPGESEASIKLLMDEGYVVEVEETVITPPNKDVEEFISVESNKDGTFKFKLEKVGTASAGTYKIKVKVRASWGTVYEMKPFNVTVNVTNSSKVTLSSKSKSITINQNVGSAEVKANLAVKGFAKQSSVDYTTDYEFVPVNELAKNASIGFKVENGTIKITDCKGYGDGKYTYNVVGIIAGTDGTVTYTKPLAFTVQLQEKPLTIVPARSSVTVYSEYCSIKNGCYVVEIPVSVEESSEIKLDTQLTNSMEEKEVYAAFNQDGTKVIVEFPTKMNKVSNLTITPDDARLSTFKVSITVKTADAKAAFSAKTVTLDRYTDEEVSNTVVDTEGYVIDSLSSIVVKDKKKKDVTEQFVVSTDRNVLTIGIASEYVDKIANGEYTVSVIPAIKIDDAMEPKALDACTFKLKLTQPSLKVSIGELKKSSVTVNLYPTLGELVSDAFEMNVYSGTVPVSISKVEIELTSKDKKKEVVEARIDDENRIILSAIEDEEGVIKNGKNTFIVKVYVKKANGEEDIPADTLKKAFVVNVRDLPKNITLAKTKLTYSPYVESNVTTTIKSAELEALMQTGDYSYVISAEETTSKYKELTEDKKNRILEVSGSEDGVITVDNVGIPTKNATYYYKLTVDFIQNDTERIVASYPVKMSVSVKNTLPKATLQMSSISLDNAFVKQEVANKVILSTGTGLWKLDALSDVDIIVKNGKKDVTGEGYFDISYDGTCFNVSLNNRDANERLMTVPKGTYKIIITPNVSEKNAEAEEGLKSPLKPLTLTVKVTSSRPTVKLASKVTVKAGDEAKVLEPVLKNKGTLTAMTVDCKPPKKATEEDVAGIEVTLLEDGMISVKAEKDVLPGSYKFTINPVTRIDGEEILLAPISITVTVKK